MFFFTFYFVVCVQSFWQLVGNWNSIVYIISNLPNSLGLAKHGNGVLLCNALCKFIMPLYSSLKSLYLFHIVTCNMSRNSHETVIERWLIEEETVLRWDYEFICYVSTDKIETCHPFWHGEWFWILRNYFLYFHIYHMNHTNVDNILITMDVLCRFRMDVNICFPIF